MAPRPASASADRMPSGGSSSDSPITRVHGDASMFVGGLAALLLQSLHPLAMAGVHAHSGFRGDPWGRLARTSHFLAVTTFGSVDDAQDAIDRVRAVHERVKGTAPDGRPYAANDPHLLSWVHVSEVVMFLEAHRRFGAEPLTPAERDEYVAQAGQVATTLGADVVPRTVAQARRPAASPTVPSCAAPPRRVPRPATSSPPRRCPSPSARPTLPIAVAAVSLLPRWARWPLRLPWLPVTEATARARRRRGDHPHRPLGPARVRRRSGSQALRSVTSTRRTVGAGVGVAAPARPAGPARGAVRRRAARRRRDAAAGGATPRPRPPAGTTKARAVDDTPTLAADTIVDCDGEVFGQPRDADDATRMLRRLSGRTHRVHTGVALRTGDEEDVAVVTTLVTMARSRPARCEWYLGTGEPFDKAGAYAIQGAGAVLVEGVRGSVSNVIGLPLTTVVRLAIASDPASAAATPGLLGTSRARRRSSLALSVAGC